MKQKMTYFAPETESMDVRVERNFLESIPAPAAHNGVQTFDGEDDVYTW